MKISGSEWENLIGDVTLEEMREVDADVTNPSDVITYAAATRRIQQWTFEWLVEYLSMVEPTGSILKGVQDMFEEMRSGVDVVNPNDLRNFYSS